jgi:hypothetical protein
MKSVRPTEQPLGRYAVHTLHTLIYTSHNVAIPWEFFAENLNINIPGYLISDLRISISATNKKYNAISMSKDDAHQTVRCANSSGIRWGDGDVEEIEMVKEVKTEMAREMRGDGDI